VADEVIAASCVGMLPFGVGWLIMQTTGGSPKAIDRTQVAAPRAEETKPKRAGRYAAPGSSPRRRTHSAVAIARSIAALKNQPGYRSRLLIGYMLTEDRRALRSSDDSPDIARPTYGNFGADMTGVEWRAFRSFAHWACPGTPHSFAADAPRIAPIEAVSMR
jgi:hypothetical protein